MSVYYDILTQVRTMIINHGPIAGSGVYPAIPQADIIFSKLVKEKEAVEQWKRLHQGPKIVIGFSGEVSSPPEEGQNDVDVVLYPVVILFIERDVGERWEAARVGLLTDRMQAIRQLFHMSNLRAFHANVTLAWCEQQDLYRGFQAIFDYASVVIPLVAKSYESRNAAGSA